MGGVSASIWYAALASECGIIISSGDPAFTRQKLYALRKELNDPDLEAISIMQSPTNPQQDLWLVKKVRTNEAQTGLSPPKSDTEPSSG